jgi:hypothetical protein
MLCRLLIVIVSSGIRLKTSRTRKNLIRMLMMVPKTLFEGGCGRKNTSAI